MWQPNSRIIDMKFGKTIFCRWTENDIAEVWEGALKAMGFKLDYKPIRTEEEILIELDVFSKRFHDKDNRFVLVRKENGLYHALEFSNEIPLGQSKWFTRDKVYKYVSELNNSIGFDKNGL